MVRDLLLDEARDLPDDAIMEVIDFMQFLKLKRNNPEHQESSDSTKHIFRKPGMYQGRKRIADDFDAPLEDFKV